MPKHIGSSKIIPCRIPNSKLFRSLAGAKFGRRKVLSLYGRTRTKWGFQYYWKCICDCGSESIVSGMALRSRSKSCGCFSSEVHSKLMKEKNTTHGKSGTHEYKVWRDMITRCEWPKSRAFKYYGGRGIKVCRRWKRFENFISDMGARPTSLHTIERIDTNGNYSPQNCIWETMSRQGRNKRNNRILSYGGIKMCVPDWADKTGISADNIHNRLGMGWSVERTLTQPERHW